jgi:hypothetical protein
MSLPTPTLNGLIIGQAERSTRALLDRILSGTATSFEQWVAINLTASSGGTIAHEDLVARMVAGLRADPALVRVTVAGLLGEGLLAGADGVVLTAAGRARFDAISAELARLTARLYAEFSADDLGVAGRVLTELTARANAELATAN